MAKLSPRQSALLKIALTLLTVTALVLIVRGREDLSKEAILNAIRRVGPGTAFWVAVLGAGQIFFMILRMYVLGPSSPRVSFKDVTFAVTVAHAVNMFFPARAGEALKVIWLGRASGGDAGYIARGAGWTIADRIVDLGGFLMMVLVTQVLFLPAFRQIVPFSLWWLVVAAIGLVGIAAAIYRFSRGAHTTLQFWLSRLREGIGGIMSPTRVSLGLAAGFGAWALEIGAIGLLSHSQGFSLTATEIFFVLVVLNIAIAVPISVANVGTFEASMAFALKFFGVDLSTSLGIAAAHHLLQLAGIAGWAILALAWNRGKSPTGASAGSGPST